MKIVIKKAAVLKRFNNRLICSPRVLCFFSVITQVIIKILASDWSSDLGLLGDNNLNGFSKWRRITSVKVTDEEISNFNQNTIPKSSKRVKKIGLKFFRRKELRKTADKLYFA